jgi:Uncharacterised nucleotidyltransferase
MSATPSTAIALSPADAVEALRPTVLALLRATPDAPAEFSAVARSFDAEADAGRWQALVLCASFHGILGAIWSQLGRVVHLPAEAHDAAVRRLAIDEIWQAHLMRGLEEAVRPMVSAGIAVSALKGPLLGARLYPPPMLRHCLDLDLLVRPDDLERATRALTAVGYSAETGVSADYLRQHGHHLAFTRQGAAPVELHFRAYAGFGVVLPAGALLDRARSVEWGGTSVLIPSPEDEFVYLAVHAAGHSFVRLMWLYDLKLFVRLNPSLDWDLIGRLAASLSVANAVAFTIRLLQTWLDVPVGPLPRALRYHGSRMWVADRLLHEVSRPRPRSIRDNLGGLLFTSLLCDRLTSGAWLLQHHVMRATRRRLQGLAPSYLPESWSA